MRPIRHLLTAVIAALTLAGVSAPAEPRPNVIFIVVDDLGYGELGCYGGKDIPTPQIDALAASGVRFTSGLVDGVQDGAIGANGEADESIQGTCFRLCLTKRGDGPPEF